VWEIQYHPASIRGRVRFVFLSKRRLRALTAALLGATAVIVTGLWLAPTGARAVSLFVATMVAEHHGRVAQAELAEGMRTLAELEGRLADARHGQRRIALVLGVFQDDSGLGGFSQPVPAGFSAPLAVAALAQANRLDTESRALLVLADELETFAGRHAELLRQVPSISPLPGGRFVLSSPFGERISPFTRGPDFHTGIDLAAAEGTPVFATGEGATVFAGRISVQTSVHWWRYGNLVAVSHGGLYLTLYSHLRDIAVRRGDKVARGQVIGSVGNTGWSTSPHLHYEVRAAETAGAELVPLDPRIFVLNYRWKEEEAALVARRKAPRPPFDPLPSTVGPR
jgi:murein DD-endopeptidase MepM/ murein hydrolase activator NlpD